MKIREYASLPEDAKRIREEVFVEEQGFCNEFDDTDDIAMHYLLFSEDGEAAAVARTYREDGCQDEILGRVAVRKQYRGRGVGSRMLREVERLLREKGATGIRLHAQSAAQDFYRRLGYEPFGEEDYDESVLHIWMRKDLS